jgi:hypothetical protein
MRYGLAAAVLMVLGGGAWADDFDEAPIRYSASTPDNVVSRLQERLAKGDARLERDAKTGYLRSVLRELQVPISSQVLVFSKTSLQRHRIGPETPRALYFNDDVYIGYCRHGDVMEVSAADPKLGTVFYTVDQRDDQAKFVRRGESCLLCHGSTRTGGFPGHLVRSVYPDSTGLPILSGGTHRIDHTSPLEKRWGGWYVTGTTGKQAHLGNLIIRTRSVPDTIDNTAGLNLTDLRGRFNTANYPSEHSDLVALMVLEHQTEAHNLITRANFATRMALHQEETLNREMKLPASHRWDSTNTRIRSAGEALVQYLLFSGEVKLTDRLRGTSAFSEEFSRRGPRDSRGRSLRDLDLERRLFRYPCSYLIYSRSFDELPGAVKEYVWKRLGEVLTGQDRTPPFAHLSDADRQAIREILVATKPDLAAWWAARDKAESR